MFLLSNGFVELFSEYSPNMLNKHVFFTFSGEI